MCGTPVQAISDHKNLTGSAGKIKIWARTVLNFDFGALERSLNGSNMSSNGSRELLYQSGATRETIKGSYQGPSTHQGASGKTGKKSLFASHTDDGKCGTGI